jgi:hypothetical protein
MTTTPTRQSERIVFDTDWMAKYKVSVPPGSVGAARIERYTITPKDAEDTNWRIIMNDEERAFSFPGEYTGLVVNKIMVMSDTAAEIHDHIPFIQKATGRVLLTGLGIGMCLQALLRKPEVEHVTVVELSADVLALVAGHYLALFGGERMTFVCDNAFCWLPPKGAHFDFVWHDIWPFAMGSYWREHVTLFYRYASVAHQQDSWRGEWMRRHWESEKVR